MGFWRSLTIKDIVHWENIYALRNHRSNYPVEKHVSTEEKVIFSYGKVTQKDFVFCILTNFKLLFSSNKRHERVTEIRFYNPRQKVSVKINRNWFWGGLNFQKGQQHYHLLPGERDASFLNKRKIEILVAQEKVGEQLNSNETNSSKITPQKSHLKNQLKRLSSLFLADSIGEEEYLLHFLLTELQLLLIGDNEPLTSYQQILLKHRKQSGK